MGEVVTVKAFRWEQEPAPVTARRSLEEDEIERALARGRILTAEQAVAHARAQDEPDTRLLTVDRQQVANHAPTPGDP